MRKQQLAARVAELERRCAEADERAHRAGSDAARLRDAIEAMPHAVVVCDAGGAVVLRNRRSHDVDWGRHGAALVERAVEEVVAAGAGLRPATQTLELHGPPPRTLQVMATPMG